MKNFLITILILIATNMFFALMITPSISKVCKILGYEIQTKECMELSLYLGGILIAVYCVFLILNALMDIIYKK